MAYAEREVEGHPHNSKSPAQRNTAGMRAGRELAYRTLCHQEPRAMDVR
jgi:hypothetical protein